MIIKMLETVIGLGHDVRRQGTKVIDNGTLLGAASHPYYPSRMENMFLDDKERLRHLYILGATGSGKTKLIESLIRQDVSSKNGFCLIDPHGDLIQNVLDFLASLSIALYSPVSLQEINKRLIILEPFNEDFATGFNPLEASKANQYPLVLELMGIFRKLWQDTYRGPRMEELLRNTLLTLASNNLTLLEAKPLLINEVFRNGLIANVSLSEVRDYWLYRYNNLSEKMQGMYREPILNRLSIFTTDSQMRSIIGQAKSTFSFREAMDSGKWLLINLGKGHLKENTYLLGAMFIAKLQNAAMSRVDMPEHRRKPFYLYVDEFQNFIGEDFKTVLSEARKYGLGLTLAHQNLAQVDTDLKSAILGNAGTQVIFRLSHRDALHIAPELSQKEKVLIERRLIDLKMGRAYFKRKGERPVLLKTAHVPNASSSAHSLERIKTASFLRYASSKAEVEKGIQERSDMILNNRVNLGIDG